MGSSPTLGIFGSDLKLAKTPLRKWLLLKMELRGRHSPLPLFNF